MITGRFTLRYVQRTKKIIIRISINSLIILLNSLLFLDLNIVYSAEIAIGDRNLRVEGDMLEVNPKYNNLVINGNVKAKSTNFELQSENLVVTYQENSDLKDVIKSSEKIKKLVASENVIILLPNNFISHSGKAEYFKETQEIILSVNPVIRSENNEIRGCIIRYYLINGSYTIESCDEEKTKATATINK